MELRMVRSNNKSLKEREDTHRRFEVRSNIAKRKYSHSCINYKGRWFPPLSSFSFSFLMFSCGNSHVVILPHGIIASCRRTVGGRRARKSRKKVNSIWIANLENPSFCRMSYSYDYVRFSSF